VLRSTPPDRPCWNFVDGPGLAEFWPRRQLHETTMHRVDLDLACGRTPLLAPDVAVDGVGEVLGVLVHRMHARGHRAQLVEPVALRATDTGDTWVMLPQAGAPLLERTAGTADVRDRVEAPAAVLYRLLWRRPVDTGSVQMSGDQAHVQAFLSSRLAPATGEVRLPLRVEATRYAGQAAGHEHGVHPAQRRLGIAVDALGGDHHDAPVPVVDVLAPFDVPLVLLRALGVLAPVVLHGDPDGLEGEVEPDEHVAELAADLEVDRRLEEPGEHEEHPQACLHRGVHPVPHVPRRRERPSRVRLGRGCAELDEPGCGAPPPASDVVTDDHEVHERQRPGELDEHVGRIGDPDAVDREDPDTGDGDVAVQAPSRASLPAPEDADVLDRVVGNRYAVEVGSGAVTDERVGRVTRQRGFGVEHR
jgi:hypothetical protein